MTTTMIKPKSGPKMGHTTQRRSPPRPTETRIYRAAWGPHITQDTTMPTSRSVSAISPHGRGM